MITTARQVLKRKLKDLDKSQEEAKQMKDVQEKKKMTIRVTN